MADASRNQPKRPAWARSKRIRWRKLVALALGSAAVLAVSYLVIANLLLQTRLLRNIVSGSSATPGVAGSSTELYLEYQRAYSILPGRVHVQGLTMRGRQRTVEWFFTLDRADVTISLVDLLRRSFHATSVRSSGLAFRARLRLDRADATPEVVAALPPIAGFADPPLLDDEPPSAPLTDEGYDLWSVNLEDVDVQHVREVWIHAVRSAGDTRVRGRWLFRPQRWLEVGPATVEANGVDVFHGNQPLATELRGSTQATLHPFDLRRVMGPAILDQVSQSGHLRGQAIIAGMLRWIEPGSSIDFKRWDAPFEAHVILDHGKLADGTRVRTGATDCVLEAQGLAFESRARSELAVDGPLVTVDTRFSGLRVSQRGVERARVAALALAVTSPHLRLARIFDDARFTLGVDGATTNDLGAWTDLLGSTSPFVVHSGMVTADAQADGSLAEGRARGALRLSVRRLSVQHGSERFSGDVMSDVRLLDASIPGGYLSAAATIATENAESRVGGAIITGKLTADVALPRWTWEERRFDFSGSKVALRELSVRSKRGAAAILVVPSLSAVAPRLDLSPAGMDGHVSIDLPRADLGDLSRVRDLLALPKELRIEGGRCRASLHADVDLGSGSLRGDSEVVARGVRLRVGSTELFGDLVGVVRARRSAAAGGSTDFSGSNLAIENAGTGNALSAEGPWWGNLALRQTALRASGGLRLETKAHLTAKDASIATALVSQNSSVPSWVVSAFRMPHLEADAQLRVAPASFEVRSLMARGGGTSIRTEYAKRDGRQDGAVLVDLGWISVGYDLAEGASGVVFFGSEGWFSRKTASMRSAAAVVEREASAAEQLARYAAMTPLLRQNEARELAGSCAPEGRSCDGTSIVSLLRAAADSGERDALSGVTHAPLLVAAAKRGTDGTTLDPLLIGGLAHALRLGGESTLDNIPQVVPAAAANDSDSARGKVIAVTGRVSSLRDEGAYSSGMLTTDAQPVYFVTPFGAQPASTTLSHFRGVFVQQYRTPDPEQSQAPALVLVGAFGPRE